MLSSTAASKISRSTKYRRHNKDERRIFEPQDRLLRLTSQEIDGVEEVMQKRMGKGTVLQEFRY